jgi:hypothetical protein
MTIDNGALLIAGSLLIIAIVIFWTWYLAEVNRK